MSLLAVVGCFGGGANLWFDIIVKLGLCVGSFHCRMSLVYCSFLFLFLLCRFIIDFYVYMFLSLSYEFDLLLIFMLVCCLFLFGFCSILLRHRVLIFHYWFLCGWSQMGVLFKCGGSGGLFWMKGLICVLTQSLRWVYV